MTNRPAPAAPTRALAPRAARRARPAARERGFSLIVAMLMLAVIGLFSAAVIRNATSGDQVANGNRLQTQANQYAQLAMRWCESQMALDASARAVPLYAAAATPAWTQHQNWTSSGASAAHTLAARDIGTSAPQPRVAPQCLMEATSTPHLVTITARGFSADFQADPATGATRNGAAVWLQATVYAESAGGDAGDPAAAVADNGPLIVRQRLWQQLLTPPF